MNTRQLLATSALAFGLAGTAFAQEATVEPVVPAASAVNRAEVRADAITALTRGTLSEFAVLNQRFEPASQLTRDAVRTATLRAIDDGSRDRIDAEASLVG